LGISIGQLFNFPGGEEMAEKASRRSLSDILGELKRSEIEVSISDFNESGYGNGKMTEVGNDFVIVLNSSGFETIFPFNAIDHITPKRIKP